MCWHIFISLVCKWSTNCGGKYFIKTFESNSLLFNFRGMQKIHVCYTVGHTLRKEGGGGLRCDRVLNVDLQGSIHFHPYRFNSCRVDFTPFLSVVTAGRNLCTLRKPVLFRRVKREAFFSHATKLKLFNQITEHWKDQTPVQP